LSSLSLPTPRRCEPCEGSLTPAIAAAAAVLVVLLLLLLLVKSTRGRQLLIKVQNKFKLNVLIMDSGTDSAKNRGEAQVFGTTTMTHASMLKVPPGTGSELGSCASSGCAWRLGVAWHSESVEAVPQPLLPRRFELAAS
tara:strand:+ start:113 stop:529 length:417 start_codon:yes stop_codon:yes gene_type:complete